MVVLRLVGHPSTGLYAVFQPETYLLWHNLTEMFSASVSFAVFFVSWYTYRETGNGRALLLGCTLLAVGLLDVFHMLSFPGMPAFVTANSTNKGIDFWIAARLLEAAGLMSWHFLREPSSERSPKTLPPMAMLAAAMLLVAAYLAIVLHAPGILPVFFVPGDGLTGTKILLEHLVMVLVAVTLVRNLRSTLKAEPGGADERWLMLTGLVFFLASETSFTLYASAFDSYNLAGHAFKVGTVCCIFLALFEQAVSRPFQAERLIALQLRHSEATNRKQAEFLQFMIDNIPFPIFYKGIDRRYIGCNRAFEAFCEAPRRDIVGKTLVETTSRETDPLHARMDDEAVSLQAAVVYEQSLTGPDGVRQERLIHKTPFLGEDGQVAGVVGVIEDITALRAAEAERLRLQEQLSQSQKLESIGRLAGGVAHDFNNMLAVIIGNAEMALLDAPETSAIHTALQDITNAAHRSAALTRQLLAFARKQPASPRLVDAGDTTESLIAMLKRLIGEGIRLNWERPIRPMPILIDPTQLDQILTNLVVNARDAAIDGIGEISIEAFIGGPDAQRLPPDAPRSARAFVVLQVRDEGCGMSADELAKVFEPFYTTKATGKGTGLGLATVYGIVKQNGGEIRVESRKGAGTTFRVCLPYRGDTVAPGSPLPEGPAEGGSETILLIEDEAMLLHNIQTTLQSLGYVVITALSPELALAEVPRHDRIDLVVTDMVMPGMGGQELARAVRATSPGTRILFMSGYAPEAVSDDAPRLDHEAFLQKPFSRQKLASAVRSALARPASPA